jgi:integrase
MSRRKRLTDQGVKSLKPRAARYAYADPELPCHYVRVQPSGAKTFCVVSRDRKGKQHWHTIGSTAVYSIDDAREKARKIIKSVRDSVAAPESFEAVADAWREQHVIGRGLRSLSEIDRFLKRLKQEWAGRDFISIRRGDVAKLLDKIERQNGARQADYALAVFRGMANWFAARNDDYVTPVVRGMKRRDEAASKRARILDDNELRAVWKQAEGNGTFGAIVRLLLLTAQRREKVAAMKWGDVIDGVWKISSEAREKGNAGVLPLPDTAVKIIRKQPRFDGNEFVFAGRGEAHFKGYSKAKAAFDAKLKKVKPWVLHDLRRTSRSLMSRAGVSSDHAERVLGHAIPGVEGIYDRHDYIEQRGDALRKLAKLIDTILTPTGAKVVRLAR